MRLSRIMRQVAAVAFAIAFLVSVSLAGDQGQVAQPTNASSSSAAQLVRRALTAEAAGETERRAEYLKDALAADPDYAPAHWQSGEVRVGDTWQAVDSAANSAIRAGKVAEYRQRRNAGHNTTDEHLQLARWCAAEGLVNQERFHLLCAMQSVTTKAQRQEVIKRLNLVRYQGTMMLPGQAELLKSQAKSRDKAMQEWRPRIVAIRRNVEGRDAVKQATGFNRLRAINDPAAIPALEAVFAKCKPEFIKAALATIASMPDQSATDSLVRHVILSDDESVQEVAAESLKSRSIYSYAPLLMSALQSLVEVQFDEICANGQYRHRLTLFQEGPLMDQSFVSSGGSQENFKIVTHPIANRATDYSSSFIPDPTADADALRAERELSANVRRTAMNQRVTSALQVATGNELGSDPAPWWNWWFDYNEMYQPPYKPVSQVVVNNTPAAPSTYRVTSVSCFPAGTPVQTSTGPLPIEQIKPGESVLAQDPDSGELAYKPVMVTTVRPPSPLIEIRLEHETIRAMRGHPFWVSGVGWQMAKELKAAQWLHTTGGPALIESVEQTGEAECFNMIVADFNTYFVGDAQVLVHDNNLRQVTTATVPGLIDP